MRRRDDISSSCPLSLTCPLYKISRKVEYDDPGEDPDPCCEELECVCRDNMYLSRNCPKWNSTFNCRSPFEMPIYNGIYPNTDGCCSDFSCVCRTNEELSKLCSEWNKTCGLNEIRIEVETRTCCPSYICECVYVTVNNKQYEVGDEFPNADDQNCSKFRVISTNLGDCPTIEKIPVKECAQEPICGQCQTKTKLRDDKCCGEIYQCVDKQCPPSQDSCRRDQKRVLTSNTTCCRTYDCRCTCSGFGSPTVETFNCNQTFEFTGNCTYLVSKGIGSDAYHVSAENVFCSDIYPSSSFAINQMCIKQMIVRYFSLVFQIFPADGTVLVNDQPATGYDQVGVNLEIETGTFSTGNRVTSISLRINDIGLVVTYNNPTIAFNPNAIGVFTIDLSSTFPTNGTKGLCGNCTRDFGDVEYECPELAPIQQEDFIEDVTCPTPCGVNDTCEEDRCNGIGSCGVCRDCKYFGHADPCLVLDNVVFDECHQSTGVPIDMIRSLCQSRQSQCFQENEENSTIATQCNPCFFTFIQQYIASCESTGFCSTYRTALGCPNDTSSCPHNQVYEHCVDDCFVQRSCTDVAAGTASSTGQCGVNFVSQCVCPNGFVFKTPDSEECINETCCCDEDPTCIETNPNFVPIANGTDDCGCTIFTGQCECHGCFDEEGKFRTPGETWERGCTKCTCQRSLLDNCFAIASQPILSCPDLKPCPDDKNYVAVLGPMENCCPTQTCECKYITVGDQQYSVGDEFPNADDQNCSKFRVISTNLGDCPTIEKIPVKECAQEPICGQCQTKTKLRDDKCCGEIYQCVDKQCPPSQDSCRRDQKRVLASNTTCCRTYDCRCTCSGFGSPTVETFNCNQTFEFTGNCTYLVSKGIGSDTYHVSAENVFCSDIYPSSSFAINQMCIKQMIVRYFSLVFQIFPADGTVLVNDQPTTGYDQVGVNLEIETGTFSTGNRVTSISLRINDIGLVVAHNNPTIAFNPNAIGVFTIDLSSTFPTNGTKGLCGNCTRDFGDVDYECPKLAPIQQEDFIEDVTCPTPCGVNDTCEEDRCNGIGSCGVCRDCEYFGHADPCLVLDNVVFDECHQSMGMSIDMIRSLCQSRQSQCFQENEENSTIATQCNPCFFTFIQQYIASCESVGFCSTYRTALGCPNDTSSCPHNQVYEHCVDDCFVQRSCSDVATGAAPSTGQCEVNFIPHCVCPNGLVLKSADSDKCINESCCNCPNPPVCEEGFNFSPVQIDIDLCDCPIYSAKCECTPLCINLVSGDIMLQNEEIASEDGCGKYICPPYDSSSNPSGTCDDIVFAYYQRNPCPVNDTCDHNMVAKYSFRSDECCPTIHCECPETKVPVCENKYEVIENTTGNCPTPVCVCKCPSIVANCSSSPGCKVLITKTSPDGCGCPVEFKCEPDSNLCPKAPECSSCQQLTVAEYVPGSEACEANCSVYRCIAKSCKTLPMSSISCLEYQEKIAYFADNDTEECCPVHDCRCKPNSILKDDCLQWEFQCEPDFIKKRTNPIEDCCPDYTCECNQAICPAPIDCQLLTLNTTWPSPKANGMHEDVCCATFSCTCEDVVCPPEVKTCPKYQKMDKRNNTINPCCPVYTCICDPSQIPSNYSLPQIQPSSSGKCNLPGQIPQPVYDETGCVAECVCYQINELIDHCTEYRTLQATCTEPQQLFPLAVAANDLDHICCPKVECRCPECGSDYVSREMLENKLKPLQIIIPEGEITACCQKYQVICNPLSNTTEFCKQYNPTCESGYKHLRHPENKECCPSTYCECDLDLCETTPECIPPQKLESTNSTNGCCKDYRCTCPEDSNENMTCTHPKVASYTNTSCPEKYCACPKKCPLDPIIDCQNKPGCRPVVSYRDEDCGCAINSTCIADPSNCNSPPVCPICYSAVEVDTILIVGDCNSLCPKYECQRNICPTPVRLPPLCSWNRLVSNNSNPCCPVDFPVCVPSLCPPVKCEPGYIKVTRDGEFYDDENNCSLDLHCCPKSECICTVCKHNLSLYEPGQEWSNDLAPCETFYCSGNKSEDGCYTVYSKPATCTIQSENNTVFHVPVGGYMQTEDPCKSKVCKQNGLGSNCSANLIESIETCPARPVCNQFQFLETIAQQNVCCPSYKCVCMQCGEDYQQFPTRHMENYEILVPMTSEQNPNQVCCPQMLYTCAEGIIVSEVCPNWNMTCLAGKELTRLNAITECCPIYECICQECPEETPVTITHACEEEVLMTIEDNPLQECCPAIKIVCREDQSCCGESYVTYDSLYQSLNLAEEIITVLSNHTCCPLHLPFCGEGAELSEVCEPYNIKCPTGYRRQRNDSDFGCCHTYYCVCDQTLCTPKPQCSPPKEYKLSAVIDSCCKLYDCVCPTDANATIKCTIPEQVFYTESVCPKKYCRCPEELDCPVNADLEACREKPGCRPTVVRDRCGCVNHTQCHSDATFCPIKPTCGMCMEPVEVGLLPSVGNCTSTCKNYVCDRVSCPEVIEPLVCSLRMIVTTEVNCCPAYRTMCKEHACPSVTCKPGFQAQFNEKYYDNDPRYKCGSDSFCCPKIECVCNSCFYNGEIHSLNNVWVKDEDPCLEHYCSSDRDDQGCYTAITRPPKCSYNNEEYSIGSIIRTNNTCTNLVCEVDYSSTTCNAKFEATSFECPDPPFCNQFYVPKSNYKQDRCCPQYECVCNKCGMDYFGPGPGRDLEWYEKAINLTLEENENQYCCPMVKIVCDEDILYKCPDANLTCEVGQEKIEINSTHPCCPKYDCVCKKCCNAPPIDESSLNDCKEIAEIPPSRNPNYMCCPQKEIVCKKVESCCNIPDCGPYEVANRTSEMNPTKSYCCPLYECVCNGKCPSGYITKEQLQMELKVGQELMQNSPEDPCCPTYRVVCAADAEYLKDCDTFNVECSSPYVLRRHVHDEGCCAIYSCQCDQTLCPQKPYCEPPSEAIYYSTSNDGCCQTYQCFCPPDRNDNLTCISPEIIAFTKTVCPTKFCRCPTSLECPVNAAVNCTSKPGCKATVTKRDSCGCARSVTCEEDPSLCPIPPVCGKCFQKLPVTVPAKAGDCESRCVMFRCDRIKCPPITDAITCSLHKYVRYLSDDFCCPRIELACVLEKCPKLTCSENSVKVIYDEYVDSDFNCSSSLNCCRREECVCNVCHHNGSVYNLYESWRSPHDICLKYDCTQRRGEDGCFVVNTGYPSCVYNDEHFPVNSVLETDYPCVILKCVERIQSGVCTHAFVMERTKCPSPPECGFFHYPKSVSVKDECCPHYICECNECPTQYLGPWPLRELEWYETTRNQTLDENPLQVCCPLVKIICHTEVLDQCPDYNKTCSYGKERVEKSSKHPCCSEYDCKCKECRKRDKPTVNDLYHCEEIVLKSLEENPNSECCPEYKVTCQNQSCCPIPNCKIDEEIQATSVSNPYTNGCCPQYECKCKPAQELSAVCKFANFTCDVGFKRVRNNSETECCPTYTCKCESCVMDNIPYPIGSSWIDPVDHCVVRECIQIGIACPIFNSRKKYECETVNATKCLAEGGQLIPNKTTGGCCNTCKSCALTDHFDFIGITNHRPGVNCSLAIPINLPYCDGACSTSSEYNIQSGTFDSICRCCQVVKSQKITYGCFCTDGSFARLEIDHATECACQETECGKK
ncbi:uncharacterized protein LOC143464528 [Clavelina lepadiformis]|uniref:uncharacterized protein LOC143464528 n=1 Tax=Clavelina lepadiformis TaxID=159417 RepID=UPI0040410D19